MLNNSEKQKRFREKKENYYKGLKERIKRMQFKVYTIYDTKVEAYLPPLFMKSKGEFLRAFAEAANNAQSPIGKHPQDYVAFEVGTWNDEDAKFDIYVAPMSLGVAIEFVKVTPDVAVPQ